jgi:hypothetical protein
MAGWQIGLMQAVHFFGQAYHSPANLLFGKIRRYGCEYKD